MEKISGILSTSPRMRADMSEAQPVRPGTPAFGRPQGVSTLTDQMIQQQMRTASSTPRRIAAEEAVSVGPGSNQSAAPVSAASKDEQLAEMAAQISNRFFLKNENPVIESLKQSTAVEAEPRVDSVGASEVVPVDGPYPKGSFIDVQA